jgi:import inner membrane translocase subunit TIM17
MWFSPKNERFYGGISLLKKRAPVLGGSFAMWAGLFGMTECFLVHIR